MDIHFHHHYTELMYFSVEPDDAKNEKEFVKIAEAAIDKLRERVVPETRIRYCFDRTNFNKGEVHKWNDLSPAVVVDALTHSLVFAHNKCFIYLDTLPRDILWTCCYYKDIKKRNETANVEVVEELVDFEPSKASFETFDFSEFLQSLLNKQEHMKDQVSKTMARQTGLLDIHGEQSIYRDFPNTVDNVVETLDTFPRGKLQKPSSSKLVDIEQPEKMKNTFESHEVVVDELIRQLHMEPSMTRISRPTTNAFYDDIIESILRRENEIAARRLDEKPTKCALAITEATTTAVRGKDELTKQDEELVRELIDKVMVMKGSRGKRILRGAWKQIKLSSKLKEKKRDLKRSVRARRDSEDADSTAVVKSFLVDSPPIAWPSLKMPEESQRKVERATRDVGIQWNLGDEDDSLYLHKKRQRKEKRQHDRRLLQQLLRDSETYKVEKLARELNLTKIEGDCEAVSIIDERKTASFGTYNSQFVKVFKVRNMGNKPLFGVKIVSDHVPEGAKLDECEFSVGPYESAVVRMVVSDATLNPNQRVLTAHAMIAGKRISPTFVVEFQHDGVSFPFRYLDELKKTHESQPEKPRDVDVESTATAIEGDDTDQNLEEDDDAHVNNFVGYVGQEFDSDVDSDFEFVAEVISAHLDGDDNSVALVSQRPIEDF